LQHAREQWTSIAEATENETDELQKSLREERLHTRSAWNGNLSRRATISKCRHG
jgi:hypothetical protein